jgi:hypothetical protein
MIFNDKKSKNEKKPKKNPSVTRRCRRGQFVLHAYSLDHKT